MGKMTDLLNYAWDYLNPPYPEDVEMTSGIQHRFVTHVKKLDPVLRDVSPKVVCLCGSTRFFQQFMEHNYKETMQGNIVLSVGFFMHSASSVHGEGVGISPEEKITLDELHKRKIDLADEVLVINVDGYIGESTRSEIAYAETIGVPIRYAFPQTP